MSVYMQDAICPKCGAIFRTRPHTKDCLEAEYDQRFLDVAIEVHGEHIKREMEKKEYEYSYGKRT